MIKRFLTLLVFLSVFLAAGSQVRNIVAGMKITRSVRVSGAIFRVDAPVDTAGAVILIEGNDITVDFNNVELKGSNKAKNPDEFFGIAIRIQNSHRVTVRNLRVSGYKVALLARNVEDLVLDHCDLSYNYRQHLNSTQEKEDISDWMSYHHNENDEWLRYGAAIYLRNCNRPTIKDCKVTGGQNALMMMECNDGKIYNNDFSFNSGIGIGMYRCTGNEVSYNKLDFNVRGYSHGVYNRGQDSAGILVYEQSNHNTFYKNSVTHGGDGFFLWAGQTTMDSGQGGCNDNLLLDNDFSYAPTNGVEVTFSRNKIIHNRIFECDHGIWGGYSYSTQITDNQFRNNRIAIAIEHGQHNLVAYNIFSRDKEAIRLWSNKQQPADWGYAKYRDTRSVDYIITGNSFNGNKGAVNLARTDSIFIYSNTYSGFDYQVKLDSTVTNVDSTERALMDTAAAYLNPEVNNPRDPFKGGGKLAGRKNILVTEWGPYDFRSPIVWNTNPVDSGAILHFDILGPAGRWKVRSVKGLEQLSASTGQVPGSITAWKVPGDRTDIALELEYMGGTVVDPFGQTFAAGKPYRFYYRKFFQPVAWRVNWFDLDTAVYNPLRNKELFPPNVRLRPVRTDTVDRLDYAWWGGIRDREGRQYPQFITSAEGQAEFVGGTYEISVTWDDAVRVFLDGRLILDEWNPSQYKFDESPNRKVRVPVSAGRHFFTVEHLELGGFATLSLKIRPVQ
jgi:parallel beta-helix repeat protein